MSEIFLLFQVLNLFSKPSKQSFNSFLIFFDLRIELGRCCHLYTALIKTVSEEMLFNHILFLVRVFSIKLLP